MNPEPEWVVTLVGGASGVGKTTLAREIAAIYGLSIFQIDDLQVALERLTSPAEQPELHFWRTNWDEFSRFDDLQLAEHFESVASGIFSPALEAVIAQHLEDSSPILIEGDFITPELATRPTFDDQANDGRVRAVFLHEDEAQISANYGGREGGDGQLFRAHASWVNSQWLRAECRRLGVGELAARPWSTVAERALAILATGTAPAEQQPKE